MSSTLLLSTAPAWFPDGDGGFPDKLFPILATESGRFLIAEVPRDNQFAGLICFTTLEVADDFAAATGKQAGSTFLSYSIDYEVAKGIVLEMPPAVACLLLYEVPNKEPVIRYVK